MECLEGSGKGRVQKQRSDPLGWLIIVSINDCHVRQQLMVKSGYLTPLSASVMMANGVLRTVPEGLGLQRRGPCCPS